MNAQEFSWKLLDELKKRDVRLQKLTRKVTSDREVIIGIEDEGNFLKIFRLKRISTNSDRMMLFALNASGNRWMRASRGEENIERLIERILGDLKHFWTFTTLDDEYANSSLEDRLAYFLSKGLMLSNGPQSVGVFGWNEGAILSVAYLVK